MRAVGYVRVSSEQQASEGVSLDAQRSRIAAWCLGNDADLAATHEDAGLSGGRADNRPGLQSALEDVCASGGVLVVYSLSRLARSIRDTLAIADRLARAGADLASLSESIDTTSAAGKMIFRLMSVLNEFERDLIAERTRSAMAYKRGKGERLGTIPYGRALADDGRRSRAGAPVSLVDDRAEIETLALIRALAESGMGPRPIARELTRLGVPTKAGPSRWAPSTVHRILGRLRPAG